MPSYYDRLSAERLERCYDLAPPEVQRYLRAEVDYLRDSIAPDSRVLELGCGYGRVLGSLVDRTDFLVGIDISAASLAMAGSRFRHVGAIRLVRMDAGALAFRPRSFDLIFCAQNGISALGVDPVELIASTVRLLSPGGKALFFSYSESFWPHRLRWFRIQSAHGLIGEIDEAATGGGDIVCRDGFRASTVGEEDFLAIASAAGVPASVFVLAESSVVCAIPAREAA